MFTIPCEQFKRLFDVFFCYLVDPFGCYICCFYADNCPGPGPDLGISYNDIATVFIFLVWCIVVNHWTAIFHHNKTVMINKRYFVHAGLDQITSFEGFKFVHLFQLLPVV